MSRTRVSRIGIAGAIASALVAAHVARAHVAPSMDDNNRYLKLTPLGDRVRLAYTIYFGEVPGAAARRELDVDHDGAISDAEAQAFGARLAEQVRPALAITIDGAAAPLAWAEVDVGMGTPVTAAGSFSVDLIAWLCLPSAGGAHTIVVRDAFAVPRPGETELRVEDTPGVRVTRARLGLIDLVDLDARWQGAGGPLAHDGFTLGFDAGDKAPIPKDGACAATRPRAASGASLGLGLWLAVAIAAALLLAAALLAASRWRKRSR
jgi:hypothetical protein